MQTQIDDSFGLVVQALLFSAQRHRDQRRKGAEGAPYINHPIEVMEMLWRVGGVRDAELLAAAVLHDTVEDTATTPEELEARFGAVVRGLVAEATDDRSLPKSERKRLQIEHAPHLTQRAKMLKMADKICNVFDMIHQPPPNWEETRRSDYLVWASQVVDGLRGANPALDAEFERVMAGI
jgi:GTP diphosphokinase / guanosine-3',5'-bis(diphosphate) 3'-diphosphatase